MSILFERFSTSTLAMLLVGSTIYITGCDGDENPVIQPQPATIVEVASDNGFNTLVAAIEAADLAETLESDGPFTVFAPTDAAFAALPAGTVDNLLKPENKDLLVSILTYHVVAGKVTSEDVVNLSKASTVEGSDISISVADGEVMVNDASVVTADVEASNGIIHVIDTVLLPPTE